tara:strand:+ start:478 stop:2190 length:1713 start_codon:yes stop_codon:yes gene_type:complete
MKKFFLVFLLLFISCSEQQDQSKELSKTDQGLSLDHKNEFIQEIIKVTDEVFVGVGFGLANSIMIESDEGLVIVDTLGSEERARVLLNEFRKISSKPIKAIIYTHNHLDHLGGATIFYNDMKPEVYAQKNILYNIANISTTIRPIIFERSARQFGIPLAEEEIIHQGIGGFLEINDESTLGLVMPTIVFEDNLTIQVDNLTVELVHVPGETDDHLYVWLPDKKVVAVGDNFYRSFANLYAIRGTKFRNPMEWVESLDKIRLLNAEYLVPSHTRPIIGKENISKALTDYRDGIQFIHDQTIRYINKGLTPDEIVQRVKLPPHLNQSPYLKEFYGSISSYIRSIFSGYIGWFSGNITELHPLESKLKAEKIAALAEKQVKIIDEANQALTNGEFQWAMELADILLAINPDDSAAKNIKAAAADHFALIQTASNDYYFYKTIAGELRGEIDVASANNKVTPQQLKSTPMKSIMKSLPVNLNAEKAIEIDRKIVFKFLDANDVFGLHIRRGIAQLIFTGFEEPDLIVTTDQQSLKEIFAGLKNVASISLALTDGTIEVEGGKMEFLKTLSLFKD